MDKIIKSIAYLGLFTGIGAVGFYMMPSDEEKRRALMGADRVYSSSSDQSARRQQDKFSNVLIAAATSEKTIYGAKSAAQQRLHERARGEE